MPENPTQKGLNKKEIHCQKVLRCESFRVGECIGSSVPLRTQSYSVCTFYLPQNVSPDLSLALLCSQVAATVPGITSSIQKKKEDYLSMYNNFKGKDKQNKTKKTLTEAPQFRL